MIETTAKFGKLPRLGLILVVGVVGVLVFGSSNVTPQESCGLTICPPPSIDPTTFGLPSCSNPYGTSAEPVNTNTGNYLFQRIDLAIPGRKLPVIFTRTYNSQDGYAGPLGNGWTHAYNILLAEQSDGTVII